MELKFDDAKLFSYTDSEIFEYISSLPSLPDYGAIVPLSHKYLAKAYATWDEVEDAPKEQFRGKVSAAIIDPKISMAIFDPVVIEDNTPQSVFTTTINHISSLTLCDQDGESSGPCLEKVAESKFETAMFDKCFVVDNMHGTTVVE
ncbi:hypothetical protein E4U46_008273 [Claviceps purpurea]|nr:hypothetical protein E4U46_008273 [Claviceps purpurea]